MLYNGLRLPKRSRDGKLSTDEEALQSLLALDTSGLVTIALRYAKLDTMQGIYERLKPGGDGKVRTVFNPGGTITGRFSSAEAFYWPASTNLQNLPAAEAARDPLFRVRDCVAEDTPILMADFTWRAASAVEIGDKLLAFEEHDRGAGHGRRWRVTTVLNKAVSERDIYRVQTEKGHLDATLEHRLLVRNGTRLRWTTVGSLQCGSYRPSRLGWMLPIWEHDASYSSGWVAGFVDGEGHVKKPGSGAAITAPQNPNGLLDQYVTCLKARSFAFKRRQIRRDRSAESVDLVGGWREVMRFLGTFQPHRLRANALKHLSDRQAEFGGAAVKSREFLRTGRVVDFTTDTHTFVAGGFGVHNCIIPDPGEVFLYADLSQAESRVVACLSEDEFLIDNWKGEFDVHKWTAANIFGCKAAEVTKEQRYIGKRARHALNYGEGPNKFWRVVNADADVSGVALTLVDAKRIHAAYHQLHPTLDGVWWNRVERDLLEHGSVDTCFGRVCRFYPRVDPDTGYLDADTLRQAVAYEPQSTVADLLNHGLLAAFRREQGNGFRLLHQAHDAILVGVRRGRAQAVAQLLKQLLEIPIKVNGRDLLIPAEVFLCEENWSEMERAA